MDVHISSYLVDSVVLGFWGHRRRPSSFALGSWFPGLLFHRPFALPDPPDWDALFWTSPPRGLYTRPLTASNPRPSFPRTEGIGAGEVRRSLRGAGSGQRTSLSGQGETRGRRQRAATTSGRRSRGGFSCSYSGPTRPEGPGRGWGALGTYVPGGFSSEFPFRGGRGP